MTLTGWNLSDVLLRFLDWLSRLSFGLDLEQKNPDPPKQKIIYTKSPTKQKTPQIQTKPQMVSLQASGDFEFSDSLFCECPISSCGLSVNDLCPSLFRV